MKTLLLFVILFIISTVSHAYVINEGGDEGEYYTGHAVMVISSITAVQNHDAVASHSATIEFESYAACDAAINDAENWDFGTASFITNTGTATTAKCFRTR